MSNSLLAGILGLDWKDILLHLLNFAILVAIAGGLIYKPVIRFCLLYTSPSPRD